MSSPDNIDKLKGIVEIDVAFIGGKEANKHESKKAHLGRGSVGKAAVLGLRERGGKTVAAPIPDENIKTIQDAVHKTVEVGSQIYSDEHVAYADLDGLFFRHDAVNHSAGEYKRGAAHTNSIESVWAVLKRGVHGVYHQVSTKHLARYVNEFAFRLNEGDVKIHTLERLNSFIDAVSGKRLTYKDATA
jgi:transposase-like protein